MSYIDIELINKEADERVRERREAKLKGMSAFITEIFRDQVKCCDGECFSILFSLSDSKIYSTITKPISFPLSFPYAAELLDLLLEELKQNKRFEVDDTTRKVTYHFNPADKPAE